MESVDKFKMHGAMTLILQLENGEFEVTHKDNLVVNTGFDLICDALGNSGARPAVLSYIGVGTGITAAAAGDTTLGTEISRLAATYAHTSGTKVFTLTSTFNPGVASGAITEAGVLNAAAVGELFDRVVFPVVNKGANDTLTAVFTFTLS